MLCIPWTAGRTNKYVLKVIGEEAGLLQKVMKMKLIFMRDESLEEARMLGIGNGRQGHGRTGTRWLNSVQEIINIKLWELQEATRDRAGWRKRIHDVARSRFRPDGTRGGDTDVSLRHTLET